MGWKKGNDCLYSACVGEGEMTNHNHTGLWRDSICHCFSFVLRKAGCLSSVSVCVWRGGAVGGQCIDTVNSLHIVQFIGVV